VAFIVEDGSILEPVQYEYRSKGDLALGTDIKLIATDAEHVEQLIAFCSQYEELKALRICSFAELRNEATPYRSATLLNSFGAYARPTTVRAMEEARAVILRQALSWIL